MKKRLFLLLFALSFHVAYGQSEAEIWSIDSVAKYLEFRYTPPKGYTQSFGELIFKTPDRPRGLSRIHNAQWIYKDKECIVYLDDGGLSTAIAEGFRNKIDKSKTEIHDATYNRIGNYLQMVSFSSSITSSQMEELEKVIKRWPEKKAKEWFNAQHVIEYPDGEKGVIYEGGYRAIRSLCIIKWEQYIELNFLVTEKGCKNIDRFMEGIKKAFWFND